MAIRLAKAAKNFSEEAVRNECYKMALSNLGGALKELTKDKGTQDPAQVQREYDEMVELIQVLTDTVTALRPQPESDALAAFQMDFIKRMYEKDLSWNEHPITTVESSSDDSKSTTSTKDTET